MSESIRRNVVARGFAPCVAVMMIVAGAGSVVAADVPSLNEIKAQWRQQRDRLQSLCVRLRREIRISGDARAFAPWSRRLLLPKHMGMDDSLFAFKGNKRYWREVSFDRKPIGIVHLCSDQAVQADVDQARSYDGQMVRERERDFASDGYLYKSLPSDDARDRFPPPEYLFNVGLAVSDPTAEDEALRSRQQMGLLSGLLERASYTASRKAEHVDGTPCVVLERTDSTPPVGEAREAKRTADRLWLALDHGLAVRKRERRLGKFLIRVLNRKFCEVLPGMWLPRRSRTEIVLHEDEPSGSEDSPAITCEMTLGKWVIDRVPDDLFDVVLTEPPEHVAASDLAPAYHWRRTGYAGDYMFSSNVDPNPTRVGAKSPSDVVQINEGWWVRGVGRRVEVRRGEELVWVAVDTFRWRFISHGDRDLVLAFPSQMDGRLPGQPMPKHRDDLIRSAEKSMCVLACEKDVREGKQVEKIIAYYRANERGYNMHFRSREDLVRGSDTEFPNRTYWFDPQTKLKLGKKCGCKWPGSDHWIDYPDPESVPRELFRFEVPRDATLEINDPVLGRQVVSEVEAGPGLRD